MMKKFGNGKIFEVFGSLTSTTIRAQIGNCEIQNHDFMNDGLKWILR